MKNETNLKGPEIQKLSKTRKLEETSSTQVWYLLNWWRYRHWLKKVPKMKLLKKCEGSRRKRFSKKNLVFWKLLKMVKKFRNQK